MLQKQTNQKKPKIKAGEERNFAKIKNLWSRFRSAIQKSNLIPNQSRNRNKKVIFRERAKINPASGVSL